MSRYKAVDCRLIHMVLVDLKRTKMMAKVKDDGFFFLFNRAQSISQSKVRSNVIVEGMKTQDKAKAGSRRFSISDAQKSQPSTSEAAKSLAGKQTDPVNQSESLNLHNALKGIEEGEEASRKAEKRQRNEFKRLQYLHITRMLSVLGYTPSASDEKRFIHYNYKSLLE